jgi:hypothetical protein
MYVEIAAMHRPAVFGLGINLLVVDSSLPSDSIDST